MPKKSSAALAYRDFLTYLSLILLLGTLVAAAVRCAIIFPPYMKMPAPSAEKAGALSWLAVPSAGAGISVLLTFARDKRFGIARGALLAICGLTVAAGDFALRFADTYYALNYVPPAVIFSAFLAVSASARALIKSRGKKKRKGIAAIVFAVPVCLLPLIAAAVALSGRKLFATLLLLFLPIPACSVAAIASVAAVSARTAALCMCLPLPACIFCAARPYGFAGAYSAAVTLSIIFPALLAASLIADIRNIRKPKKGENYMANKVIPGLGFHHIALKAHDFEESLKFYTEGLGMQQVAAWGEGDGRIVMLDIGDGTILELFAGGAEHAEVGRYMHLALKCDDVDAAFAAAVKAGAKPKMEPTTVPVASQPKPMTLRVAFVYGPSGEEVEFFKVVG